MPSFLHVGGVRHHESKVSCQGTQHNDPNITGPKPGPLNKESIALITRPQHLLHVYCKVLSLTYYNRQWDFKVPDFLMLGLDLMLWVCTVFVLHTQLIAWKIFAAGWLSMANRWVQERCLSGEFHRHLLREGRAGSEKWLKWLPPKAMLTKWLT